VQPEEDPVGEQLDSWKEIAVYLGREVRTVQRWAKARDLPVHRFPGGERPRVYALKSEIDAWLRAAGPAAGGRALSVAVLPFVNLAGAEGDRLFGDGLADDLINELVRIPGLRVIARTSSFACAAGTRDVREIGAQLGAGWLVEGSVRRDRQCVRVSAQLVNTRDGGHAWSERYDRNLNDMFAIQDEIARSIALALQLTLLPQPVPAGPRDPATYDLWVKGRALSQQFTPQAFAQAREYYEAAIAREPQFARPHFGLADLLFYGAEFGVAEPPAVVPRAREALGRSLELDQRSGEAHALLGIFRGLLDYDWSGAAAAFRRAFQLSPGSAALLSQHAWYYLVPTMRLAEAAEEAQRAVTLDPLSPSAHGRLGLVLQAARQYERACDAGRTAVQLAPGLWWLRWFYGTALLLQGSIDEGFRQCWQVYQQNRRPLVIGAMSAVCGLYGERPEARALLGELEQIARHTAVPPYGFAFAYLGLGDDRVFEWLDRAIAARDPIATHLPSMPMYDGLRADPRFPILLAKVGLAPSLR
jgi:excisionase family DNA binding protein